MKGNLSVIIPAYQAEKHLVEAVQSVRTQHGVGDVEIIIVDDGSSDETFTLAEKYGDVVLTQPHGGAAKARNAGFRAASGDWILFLDADDILLPDALRKLTEPFAGQAELAVVFGRAEDFLSPEAVPGQGVSCRPGSYGGVLPGCAVMRSSAFREVGFFDENLTSGETVAWQIKLRQSNLPVVYLADVVLRRRIHPNNTGRLDRQRELQNYAAVLRERMQR